MFFLFRHAPTQWALLEMLLLEQPLQRLHHHEYSLVRYAFFSAFVPHPKYSVANFMSKYFRVIQSGKVPNVTYVLSFLHAHDHREICQSLPLTNANMYLSGMTQFIDNTWAMLQMRADQTGKHLAQVLHERIQGHRPVVLVRVSCYV